MEILINLQATLQTFYAVFSDYTFVTVLHMCDIYYTEFITWNRQLHCGESVVCSQLSHYEFI